MVSTRRAPVQEEKVENKKELKELEKVKENKMKKVSENIAKETKVTNENAEKTKTQSNAVIHDLKVSSSMLPPWTNKELDAPRAPLPVTRRIPSAPPKRPISSPARIPSTSTTLSFQSPLRQTLASPAQVQKQARLQSLLSPTVASRLKSTESQNSPKRFVSPLVALAMKSAKVASIKQETPKKRVTRLTAKEKENTKPELAPTENETTKPVMKSKPNPVVVIPESTLPLQKLEALESLVRELKELNVSKDKALQELQRAMERKDHELTRLRSETSEWHQHSKRPLTAYRVFIRERRSALEATRPTATSQQISQLIRSEWSSMDKKARLPYESMVKQESNKN